jgi:FixJ family two-component response regulator
MSPRHSVHILGSRNLSATRVASFLTSQNLSVVQHSCADDFFRPWSETVEASCLVMDLELPERGGFELLQELLARPDAPSVIFVTDSRDVTCAVRAIKAGAAEVLEEPIDPKIFLSAVISALERNEQLRAQRKERMQLRQRYERLTRRERQVLPLVLGGWLIKQSAYALGIADITLQTHRTKIMKKMEAKSLPDLVRMGMKLGIRHANSFRTEAFIREAVTCSSSNSIPMHSSNLDFSGVLPD